MPTQTVWRHIDVPLPALKYQNLTASGQGKGSTEWAAHSHTPIGLEEWEDFDALVAAEGQHARNQRMLDLDLAQQFDLVAGFFNPVSEEENVTDRLETVLSVFASDRWDLSGGFGFPKQNQQIIGKPDLIAQKKNWDGLGVGYAAEYQSPPPRGRAQVRRNNTELIVSLFSMPFETKPFWKFGFLKTAQNIIKEWEIPSDFEPAKMQAKVPLPESWSKEKKRVFHLVRQFYGQMVADKRRYGILTLYERWFFCKRTPEGTLKISRSFQRDETSPSILQAIKTMVQFGDHPLEQVQIHPQSASKVTVKGRKAGNSTSKSFPLPPTYGGRSPESLRDGKHESEKGGTVDSEMNLAALLYPWDCDVYDSTDSVLLLTTTKDPSVIVKLQSDPRKKHVAEEMAHEAAVYTAIEGNKFIQNVIPRFRGHSTHLGVAMICLERELDDFDDIGLENLSGALKQSAVQAVKVLSEAGVLHNDIELRNIVKSRRDPASAKIIDFGRASFSSDSTLLARQVEKINILLKMDY